MIPTDEIKEAVKKAALASFPWEANGLVIEPSDKPDEQEFIECQNIHREPYHHFEILKSEWDAAEARGTILSMWHTHPNELAAASWDDMATAEAWDLPMLIYATPADTWDWFTPHGWVAPFIGRPFVYGIFDCYTLAIDFYKSQLDLELPYIQTEFGWWVHKRDAKGNIIAYAPEIYLDNIQNSDMAIVPDLKKYDLILMRVIHGALCHCGIYMGDGHMLHHVIDNPSRIIAYQPDVGHYGNATEYFLRHKSFL